MIDTIARPGRHARPGHARTRLSRQLLAFCLAVFATGAAAIQPTDSSQRSIPKLTRAFVAPELRVQPELESASSLTAAAAQKPAAAAFLRRNGGSWQMRWDARADRPNLVEGSGIPLLPGKGNTLTPANLGLTSTQAVDMATVEARLRDFIDANRDLLKTDGLDFRLDADNSTPYGDGSTHWFVDFAQYHEGVRVDRAHLFFRISHGNVVQFGSDLVAPVTTDVHPSSTRDNAFELAVRELGFPSGTQIVDIVEPGELLLLPVAPRIEIAGENFIGKAGEGYEHKLAWRFVFRVNDDDATYEALFDAHTNRVIEVRNLTVNADAAVTGGIYPTTNSDPEVVKPMPFAAVTNNGAKITDVLGIYDYSGGTATTTLNGKYFRMSDGCGSISLSSTTDGNLALGTSGGTDCITPGVGGAGNTHASRTGFYHLTNINRKAVTFFPSNAWLASTVTANMNVNDVCNAGWDGSTLNFFKSGSGCSNTGEIAAVFLHEWGHGMDTNTGGAASEYGSGEAVGDTFAFLETKDACIGKNFKPGVPCYNCKATCTGVRDVEAFSTHGAAMIAKSSTVTSTSGTGCARWACPYLQQGVFPYQGPMGYEGHCESYIASSANWDLSQALIDKYGEQQGWHEMDRIWYGSLVPSKSAYRVASGGKCNINAQVDGCGANNWYTVFLAADDDDGNLANGTPNACRIWDAFNAHGIACGVKPECSATPADFTLEATGNDHATLCAGLGSPVSYGLQIGATGDFHNVVTLGASGAPAGTSVTIDPPSGTPGIFANVSIDSPQPAPGQQPPPVGDYVVTIAGTATGSPGHSLPLYLSVRTSANTTTLSSPVDAATGVAIPTTFNWQPAANAETYHLVVATDPALHDTVVSEHLASTTFTTSALQPGTTYYWGAYSEASCGGGTQTFSFTTAQKYHVGGNVGGLAGSGLALSLNQNAQTIAVAANGSFAFPIPIADGSAYTVVVDTQPSSPAQVCTIANGSGTIHSTDVSDIEVTCTTPPPPTYTVGGSISGLGGSGLALQLNGTSILPVTANGAFVFGESLPAGATYDVTVAVSPSNPAQTCTVTDGSGTMRSADVTRVKVTCVNDILDRIFENGFDMAP